MNREEAIEVLSQDLPCEHDTDLIEALKIAIRALEHPEENVVKIIPHGDTISKKDTLAKFDPVSDWSAYQIIKGMPSAEKTGHCEDCKHFRKLPMHTSTIGKCIQHMGLCPKGDWYCADFEPQESEVRNEMR